MPPRGKQWAVICFLAFSVAKLSGCANSLSGNSAIQITPNAALLAPGQKLQFTAIVKVPNPSPFFLWQVNGVVGGSASTGTITTDGVCTAPVTPTTPQIQVGVRGQAALATVSVFDPSHPGPGSVAATQNPLVAAYTIPIPVGSSVHVQFGTDTTYGLSTSGVPAPTVGGVATVLVAGMRASTTCHMQAIIELGGGSQATDGDHTFMTGAIPANILPNISTRLTGVGTPSPGVELLSLNAFSPENMLSALATDLAGNVIWYYDMPAGSYPFPIKLLPNGHMLLITSGSVNDVREIDLAGNT